MADEIHWQKLGQKEVLNHRRMQLREDEVRLPDGTPSNYLIEINKPDYVTVIAMQDDLFVMVYDYSYPNDKMLLQFPEGMINSGETAEQAAHRELQEEGGFGAVHLEQVGFNLDQPRRNTSRDLIFVATDLVEAEAERDAEEAGMSVVRLSEAEINTKIAQGEIIQKNALAAWTIYQARKAVQNLP